METSLDQLASDIKRFESAVRKANGYSLPDGLRAELVDAMEKLLAFLKGGYGEPVHMCKPKAAQSPAEPKREPTKKVSDTERKKSMKIKIVPKATQEAEKAAPAPEPSPVTRTPVGADQYVILARSFGADFAQRYYVASAEKTAGDFWPKEQGWDNYVQPSAKELATRAALMARRLAQEALEAAEKAGRVKVSNTYNDMFKGR